jgi:alcohol dehydrogenase class IV
MTMFGLLRGPRHVVLGAGQRSALPPLVAAVGSRAFVCTDERFAGTPQFAALVDDLRVAGVHVTTFAEALPDVPVDQVLSCAEQARKATPDVLIGLGGGSCIDLAKSVAVVLAHGGHPRDYYGEFRVPGAAVPVIALPTTAGTGSEVTPVAVLTDPERVSKVGISSPHIIPYAAVCDPELTYGAPPALTAHAGADALSHAVEAFTAISRVASPQLGSTRVFVGKNALTDTYALLAVRLIAGNLHRAWSSDDEEARAAMMLAATAGGFALGTAGTAAAHAIQYPLGALTHTPHGVGVGALLPYVMEFNLPARVEEMATIARTMGVGKAGDDPESLAHAAVEAVGELLHSVGIPRNIAELGLAEDRIDWTAEQSMHAARLVENNPRALDRDAMTRIVRAAHSGDRDSLRDDPVALSAAAGGL